MQALSLKAELEVSRGNLRRAAKLVVGPAEEGSPSSADRAAMLSNMGCIQHREAKHVAAALCFGQALQAAQSNQPALLAAVSPFLALVWPYMHRHIHTHVA